MWESRYQVWLKNCAREGRAELLSIAKDRQEIYERFGEELQFGTAGIRGVFGYGTNRMNIHTVARATQGIAQYILAMGESARERGVVIAYDTRAYSYTFAEVAAKVLAKNNIQCYLYQNPQPVPVLSFTVQKLHTFVGIMITASHNPKEYNGYKVYGASGSQMSVDDTAKIVQEIEKVDYFTPLENGMDRSNILEVPEEIIQEYYHYIQSLRLNVVDRQVAQNIQLVYTPLHGTGKRHIEKLLQAKNLKVDIVRTQSMPDGNFSTVKMPNPEMKESLQKAIELAESLQANTVFATDPDADRLGVAVRDNHGEFVVLTGNQVGLLLLEYILSSQKVAGNLAENGAVIKSFVSSPLAQKICESFEVECIDVSVGFKFIGEKILEWKNNQEKSFLFGFEESCGYLYGIEGSKDKDAVLAAVMFAEFACKLEEQGRTVYEKLQELYCRYGYGVDRTENIAFHGLGAMQEMAAAVESMRTQKITMLGDMQVVAVHDHAKGIKEYADGRVEGLDIAKSNALYFELDGGSFVAMRPSGTEPKLKIYYSIVAESAESAEERVKSLQQAFKNFFKK